MYISFYSKYWCSAEEVQEVIALILVLSHKTPFLQLYSIKTITTTASEIIQDAKVIDLLYYYTVYVWC